MKKLAFAWTAHPLRSDNYYAVSSALATLDSGAQRPTLATELDGGATFVFMLTVTNFLGRSSPAAAVSALGSAHCGLPQKPSFASWLYLSAENDACEGADFGFWREAGSELRRALAVLPRTMGCSSQPIGMV